MSAVELNADLAELKSHLEKAERPRVKTLLNFEIRKVEAELLKFNKEDTNPTEAQTQTKPVVPQVSKNYEVKLQNYAWDQSDNLVKLFVTLPGVQNLPQDQIQATAGGRSIELRVSGLENKDYVLHINNLLEPIGECSSKIKKDMVVVSMKKRSMGSHWSHITEVEKRAADAKVSKTKMDSSDSADPTAGLMGMMKQMYEDGDDDMKRMIAKAWTEGRSKSPDMGPDFNL
ncbi:calcyclin-binding protein [Cloeon dipterum]|uniref:calcyclin-binding protein n=1 Tax=Cloeon dipterum TaxID=197152 RepID=UPI00321F628C